MLFVVMSKPYIDYTKLLTCRRKSFLNTAEIKIFCIWIAIDEFSERTVFDGTQTCTFQTHVT